MRFLKALLLASVCVGAPVAASAQERVYDPWEGFNRRMYAVNDALDHVIFEPVAKGYRAATPRFVRTGVRNFLGNLNSPVTFANDVLQGEGKRAGVTLARFGLNTTVGVFGLLDPATEVGLEKHTEDFGQTLAVWGAPSGPYLFLPAVGPTTVRDGLGQVVDFAFRPLSWAHFENDETIRTAIGATSAVSAREGVIDAIDDLRESSLDPYVSIRSTYGLYRWSAIQNGPADVQDLPDFESIPTYEAPAEAAPGTDLGADLGADMGAGDANGDDVGGATESAPAPAPPPQSPPSHGVTQ